MRRLREMAGGGPFDGARRHPARHRQLRSTWTTGGPTTASSRCARRCTARASPASTRPSSPTGCSSCSFRRPSAACSPSTARSGRRTRSAGTAWRSTGAPNGRVGLVLEVELQGPRAPRRASSRTRRRSPRATAEAYVEMEFKPLYFGVTTLEEAAPDLDWRFHEGELNEISERLQATYEYGFMVGYVGEPMSAPAAVDFPGLLSQTGARHAERPALSFYRGKALEGRLSYGELLEASRRWPGGLSRAVRRAAGRPRRASSRRTGSRCRCWCWRCCAWARWWCRSTRARPPEDWTYILKHSGARGLCAHARAPARVPPAARGRPSRCTSRTPSPLARRRAPTPPSGLAEQLAVVLYTSGTTGNPKGVALRQRNLHRQRLEHGAELPPRRDDAVAVLPLYHAHAFGFGLMTALSTGGHLVFTERLEPFTWAEVIRAESVEVTSVVPVAPARCCSPPASRREGADPAAHPGLVGAADVRTLPATSRRAREIPLIQGWGLSEYTNFACCVSPFASPGGARAADVLLGGAVHRPGARGHRSARRRRRAARRSAEGDARRARRPRALDDARLLPGPGEHGAHHRRRRLAAHRRRGLFPPARRHARSSSSPGGIKEIIIRDAEKYSPLRLERRLVEALPELSGRLVVLGFPHREHGEEVGAYLEIDALRRSAARDGSAAAIEAMPRRRAAQGGAARHAAHPAHAHRQDPAAQDAALVRALGRTPRRRRWWTRCRRVSRSSS